jgi:hypothetical protein
MFVVLQKEIPISTNLLEAIVEIRNENECREFVSEKVKDRLICVGTPCGCKGPCNVRYLQY